MKVGFTGTQVGMSRAQRVWLEEYLRGAFPSTSPPDEFHHGDCVGADVEAHSLVRELTFPPLIVIHPPRNASKRAFTFKQRNKGGTLQLPSKGYIERNHDIVDATDVLVAAPRTDKEEIRSGTWATVRYALRLGRVVHIIPR